MLRVAIDTNVLVSAIIDNGKHRLLLLKLLQEHIALLSPMILAELADVIIRIMDYARGKGLNVAEALVLKMEYNTTRPYKHGGKKF